MPACIASCKVPLRDVLDLESRGCYKLKRGNTGVPMWMGVARFTGVVPLLYCADAFDIQRKRGLDLPLVVFGMARCTRINAHTHTQKQRS